MKKLFIYVAFLFFPVIAHAQWTTLGSNIYNSNSGNVGIGKTNPDKKLDVVGTGRFTDRLILGTQAPVSSGMLDIYDPTSAPTKFVLRGDISTLEIGIDKDWRQLTSWTQPGDISFRALSNRSFNFYAENPDNEVRKFFVIGDKVNGGWMSLYTNRRLEIDGDAFMGSAVRNFTLAYGVYGRKLYFGGKNEDTDPFWLSRFYTSAEKSELRMNLGDDGGADDAFAVGFRSYLEPEDAFTNVFRVAANGQVDVVKNLSVGGNLSLGGSLLSDLKLSKALRMGFNNAIYLGPGGPGTPRLKVYHNGQGVIADYNSQFLFRCVSNTGVNSTAMIMGPTGNVGIGTSNIGTYKLSVNGTIRAKEIKVESDWADFVFAADYKLPTLTEVEDHIKTHKHLPGIPKEEEVAKNGVNVGEMQGKLLQKIEELTLYTINQQHLIEELQKEIQAMKNK